MANNISVHGSRYGWKKDSLDFRDFKVTAPKSVKKNLPASFDLTSNMPPVYDQGQLGSCTANGIAAAIQFDDMKQGLPNSDVMPSRLFIYYNERVLENDVSQDNGAQIRDGVKTCAVQGACSAKYWAYVIKKFAVKPPKTAYVEALKHKITSYRSVPQVLSEMQSCIVSGFPIVFGVSVFDSFEADAVIQSGDVPMPQRSESNIGGHCMVLCGYNNKTSRFNFRNSWGTSYGKAGYGTIPYEYILNAQLCSDCWVINSTF